VDNDILKDVILSTLAEIEEEEVILDDPFEEPIEEIKEIQKPEIVTIQENQKEEIEPKAEETPLDIFQDSPILEQEIEKPQEVKIEIEQPDIQTSSEKDVEIIDRIFLESIQEKIATLFVGLKSDEMKDKDKKLDITLKYLEYLLISIDEKLT